MKILTLSTRPGCHLCERARAILAGEAAARSCTLLVIDVETEPALESRYGERIRVVELDDRELPAWPFTAARARAALTAELAGERRRR